MATIPMLYGQSTTDTAYMHQNIFGKKNICNLSSDPDPLPLHGADRNLVFAPERRADQHYQELA